LPELKKKIDAGDITILPESKKKEVLGLFKQEINDFSILTGKNGSGKTHFLNALKKGHI
jgi:AAA15 family ATPase/GTPase